MFNNLFNFTSFGIVQKGALLNPFKDSIIYYMNLLTDTTDTDYNGITPSTSDIELAVDLINGEII